MNPVNAPRAAGTLVCLVGVAAIGLTMFVAAADIASVRLAWDPSPDPTVVGYRVYVGTRPGVYTSTYNVPLQTSFEHKGIAGTRYYFAVASYTAGQLVGALSREVSGYAVARRPVGIESDSSPGATDALAYSTSTRPAVTGAEPHRCLATAEPRCFGVTTPAASLGDISTMASLPDGDLLFVENGRRVRVVVGNDALDEPLLEVDASTRVAHMAVDPAFAGSGRVYVALLKRLDDGRREFSIVRYRLLGRQFGEPATIVAGLAVGPHGDARIAIDGREHLYVALPGSGNGAELSDLSATVLRLNTDGSLPRDNPASSPVLARGYEQPVALAWDETSRTLWLSGIDASAQTSVSFIKMDSETGHAWPRVPNVAWIGAPGSSSGMSSFVGIASLGTALLLVPTPRDGAIPAFMNLEAFGTPSAVARGEGGQIYVGLGRPGAPPGSMPRIVRLRLASSSDSP